MYTNFCLALNHQHSVFKWLLSHEVLPSKTHSTDSVSVPISINYTVWPLLIFVHSLQEEFPESGAALCRHEHFPEFSRTVPHAESGGQVGQLKVDSPRYVCTWQQALLSAKLSIAGVNIYCVLSSRQRRNSFSKRSVWLPDLSRQLQVSGKPEVE